MKCDIYEILISAYADGELDGPKKADLEAHLDECKDCKHLYEETVHIQHDIADVLACCPAVPDLTSAVTDAIRPRHGFRLNWRWAAAAAAALVAFCSYTLLQFQPGTRTAETKPPAPEQKIVREQPKLDPPRQVPKVLVENKPQRSAPKPHVNKAPKPAPRPVPATDHIANTADVLPNVAVEEAEVVVEYVDGTIPSGYAADPYTSPAPPTLAAGTDGQVVAETEVVMINGTPTQRISYRIIENKAETLKEPDRGEQNETD